MSKNFHLQISGRDIEILTSLTRTPLTASQLFKLSSTFERPFGNPQNLRRRLRSLANASLVRCYRYAIANDGRSPSYFRLTQKGYRTLFDDGSTLPKRRYFEAVSDAHHHHTNSLAELIVHLSCTAHKSDYSIENFTCENAVCLEAEPFRLFPDCTFQLVTPNKRFNFIVELDNGSERVRSKLDTESIERKIRGYDLHQSSYDSTDPKRYLVLFVTTRTKKRLDYMLETASELMSNRHRTVFVGADLKTILECGEPFNSKAWMDPNGKRISLTYCKTSPKNNCPTLLTPAMQLC